MSNLFRSPKQFIKIESAALTDNAKISIVVSKDATDQKTHGLDHITILSYGSDHFLDQQKRKKARQI